LRQRPPPVLAAGGTTAERRVVAEHPLDRLEEAQTRRGGDRRGVEHAVRRVRGAVAVGVRWRLGVATLRGAVATLVGAVAGRPEGRGAVRARSTRRARRGRWRRVGHRSGWLARCWRDRLAPAGICLLQ